MRKSLRILSNSAKFLLVGPYIQRIILRPLWPSPPAFIVWGLWPPSNFWRLKICRDSCVVSTGRAALRGNPTG